MTTEKRKARIVELDKLIAPLLLEKQGLEQLVLETEAPVKVGETICWNTGIETARGRVISVHQWTCGIPKYRVRRLRKDGTEGNLVWVYNYHGAKKE